MTLHLPPLYHWAPTERRKQILRYGLRPNMRPTISLNDGGWKAPHVCLSPTPSCAWGLSGGIFAEADSTWDLWQVVLADEDEVHIRPDWGPKILEVRVANRIPKSRLWWVGSRTEPARRSTRG